MLTAVSIALLIGLLILLLGSIILWTNYHYLINVILGDYRQGTVHQQEDNLSDDVIEQLLAGLMEYFVHYNIDIPTIAGFRRDNGQLAVQFRVNPNFLSVNENIERLSSVMVELFEISPETNKTSHMVWVYMKNWDHFF